jgi:uncharacterized membrane protein
MQGAARRAWKAPLLLLFVGLQVLAHFALRDSVGVQAACGISHAAAYLILLCYFGRTLLPGREPLITRLARRVHGGLPPGIAEFTRGVTLFWCVFFAAQVAVSALLLAFAPFEYWSLFVNVLNLPLVGLMFAIDYAARAIRFRGQPRVPLSRILRAFAEVTSEPEGSKAR